MHDVCLRYSRLSLPPAKPFSSIPVCDVPFSTSDGLNRLDLQQEQCCQKGCCRGSTLTV
jgi:hypothetical protein